MSPFIATAQSKVLLKAAPNFSTNCSLVQSLSFSLPALADHTPVPTTILLGSWDTESYAASSIAPEYASAARPTTVRKLMR